jgi:hypothetical protein
MLSSPATNANGPFDDRLTALAPNIIGNSIDHSLQTGLLDRFDAFGKSSRIQLFSASEGCSSLSTPGLRETAVVPIELSGYWPQNSVTL